MPGGKNKRKCSVTKDYSATEELERKHDAFSFRVKLRDNPDDEPLTIVIYDWFTQEGSPPRAGNKAEVLVDGAQTWAYVHSDMQAAKKDIRIATWLCRPDMELLRPEQLGVTEPFEREDYRFGQLLDQKAQQGVIARVLLWGMTSIPICWGCRTNGWFSRGKAGRRPFP